MAERWSTYRSCARVSDGELNTCGHCTDLASGCDGLQCCHLLPEYALRGVSHGQDEQLTRGDGKRDPSAHERHWCRHGSERAT